MSRGKETNTKLSHQKVAEQVLQMYTKSLQDHKSLKVIISESCVLDYFGKLFYGQDKVVSHLISNLHGSNYELSSLSINDRPSLPQFNPISNSQDNLDDDLGVTLMSPPKFTFSSATLSTPIRSFSQSRKRSGCKTLEEISMENCKTQLKKCKTETTAEVSSSNEKTDNEQKQDMVTSPDFVQNFFHKDMKYLTAYGTICYPKRVLPTVDLKRIKQHSLIALRGRFCQLYIGFECDSHVINATNCRIRTIRYSLSSRITPRNLLKAFNEVETNS